MAARQNHRSLVLPNLLARALSGPRAISLAAYLYLFPFGVLITINSYAPIAPELEFHYLFIAGILGMAVVGVVLLVAQVFLPKVSSSSIRRATYLLVIFVLAGMSRSLMTYQMVVAGSDISFIVADLLRVSMLGAMHGVVWLSLFAILLHLADEYRSNRTKLIQLQNQFHEHSRQAEQNLAQDIQQVQEMIRSRLQPVMHRVTRQIQVSNPAGSRILTAAEDLRETCDVEVRNLSHRLSEPFAENEQKSQLVEQISWRKLISPRFFQAELHLFPLFGVTFYLGAFQVIAQRRPELLFHNLIAMSLGLCVSLLLVKFFWRRFFWRWRILQVALIHALSVGVIWLVVLQDFGYQNYPNLQTHVMLQLPFSFVALWVIFSFLSGFQAFGAEVAEEREKLEQLFEHEQQQYRVKRTKLRNLLSKLLHGNVQGGLAAVSLALVSSQTVQGENQRELIEQAEVQLRKVQTELNKILALELHDVQLAGSDTSLSIESIQAELGQWEGLLEVDLEISPIALLEAQNRSLGAAVLTAIRESLQNSVRHGHARNVEISFQLIADEIVLEIVDDGAFELSDPVVEGHGGREIAASRGSRSITRADARTTVRIVWQVSALV